MYDLTPSYFNSNDSPFLGAYFFHIIEILEKHAIYIIDEFAHITKAMHDVIPNNMCALFNCNIQD